MVKNLICNSKLPNIIQLWGVVKGPPNIIQGGSAMTVTDPGEGPRGTAPPYFSTKMWAKGPKKMFLETRNLLPPRLSQGLDPPLHDVQPLTLFIYHCWQKRLYTMSIDKWYSFNIRYLQSPISFQLKKRIMDNSLGTLLHFWGVFQFTKVQPLPSSHKQCWTRVSRISSEFQVCIGWGEGELQENFEKEALF